MTDSRTPAVLVLEDGRTFHGHSIGATQAVDGEVVFTTTMTGYQEVLSDPSYAGQVVCFTYPLIGNVGVNAFDMETVTPLCRGLVVRQLSRRTSNHRAEGTLPDWLARHGLTGMEGVDTRALARHLRHHGSMRGVIATGSEVEYTGALVDRARHAAGVTDQDLASSAGCAGRQSFRLVDGDKELRDHDPTPPSDGDAPYVVVLDYGVKHGILECLAECGARVSVLPGTEDPAAVLALEPDGVVLSNGPGDPAAVTGGIDTVRGLVDRVPLLGICLGHQLLALALGMRTVKLPFGHHGANHPVRDLRSGRVLVTSQNHGFALAEVPESMAGDVQVTHVSLVDGTIEGFAVPNRHVTSIQFHPEASPGPREARTILIDFVRGLKAEHAGTS